MQNSTDQGIAILHSLKKIFLAKFLINNEQQKEKIKASTRAVVRLCSLLCWVR
jgi:hypothetical protein